MKVASYNKSFRYYIFAAVAVLTLCFMLHQIVALKQKVERGYSAPTLAERREFRDWVASTPTPKEVPDSWKPKNLPPTSFKNIKETK